mmetsp:Transcript_30207/g.36689  ORF Transcript_30207/g.36689 Transcript_30207/m.36689 type:complete len:115 (+) Transcript_30207:177-521(+)
MRVHNINRTQQHLLNLLLVVKLCRQHSVTITIAVPYSPHCCRLDPTINISTTPSSPRRGKPDVTTFSRSLVAAMDNWKSCVPFGLSSTSLRWSWVACHAFRMFNSELCMSLQAP